MRVSTECRARAAASSSRSRSTHRDRRHLHPGTGVTQDLELDPMTAERREMDFVTRSTPARAEGRSLAQTSEREESEKGRSQAGRSFGYNLPRPRSVAKSVSVARPRRGHGARLPEQGRPGEVRARSSSRSLPAREASLEQLKARPSGHQRHAHERASEGHGNDRSPRGLGTRLGDLSPPDVQQADGQRRRPRTSEVEAETVAWPREVESR